MTEGSGSRVLLLTPEWPVAERPLAGQFVRHQVDALRELGIDIDVDHFRGLARPLTYASVYRRMLAKLATQEYALVHAHWGQAGLLAVTQGLVPSIVTLHGSDVFGTGETSARGRVRSWVLRAVTRLAANRATAVIAVSQTLAWATGRSDANIIPMGIDLGFFHPGSKADARRILGWDLRDEVVLFMGDPGSPIKRVDLARAAVAVVRSVRPTARLVICVGQPADRVRLHYQAADVLVITSTHEGGPLVAWEALACNLPVVSVDVGGVRGRVHNVARCEVVKAPHPKTIGGALIRSLDVSQPIDGRGAVADLDQLSIASRVAAVYSRACGRSLPAARGYA